MAGKNALTRTLILIRRIHLYAGLFLLPWVFLYGITGAMFNHQGLLPEVSIIDLSGQQLTDAQLDRFPSPEQLASQVVDSLQRAAPDAEISLAADAGAEYNNNVILEVHAGGKTHAVHIDPIEHSARVVVLPEKEDLPRLLGDVRNIRLQDNPYQLAKEAVPEIMQAAGITSTQSPQPRGWCKLNFLADVDGDLARVTYVLRDGHVDITRFDGQDGMTTRQFLMRLHTSHGQPPHWNGRMFWSLILDVMAIAMVTWGVTGLVMWWQLKRTRLIGALVIVTSVATALWLYTSVSHFYARTMM